MPGTIGYDSFADLGGVDIPVTDTHKLMSNVGVYTAVPGDFVTTIGFRAPGSGSYGDLELGVYNDTTLALMVSGVVTSLGEGRYIAAVTPTALVDGEDYSIGFRNADTGDVSIWRGYFEPAGLASAATGATPLENPFDPAGTHNSRMSIFAIVEAVGATLTTIGDDNEVQENEDFFTYEGVGLEDADHLRISSTNTTVTQEWAITMVTDTGGTVTEAIRGQLPFSDANHVLTVAVEDASDVVIASRTFSYRASSPEFLLEFLDVLPLSEATTLRTVESALNSLPTIPANSQCIMPPFIEVGVDQYEIVYEMSSGCWTGVVSIPDYVILEPIEIDGEYRPGPDGPWEPLPVTLVPEGWSPPVGDGTATIGDAFAALPAGGAGAPA